MPTIKKPNQYFDATIYTGNGSARSITNEGSFKPDFVWVKSRSNAYANRLADSVRGAGKEIFSNETTAETTNDSGGYVSAFNSNGFSFPGGGVGVNGNALTYVAWQWQAGQGSTSSNTNGSITSTVSVNTTAGFSIATFNTGASGGKTVGHGLGVKPAMLIFKDMSNANNWLVWHQSYSNQAQGHQILNGTQAVVNDATVWNNTAPTSTVASITSGYGFGTSANAVMYAWAEIAGFSKFGSYTGNGSSDGPFLYMGFRPKWIMIKRTDTSGQSWYIEDSSRNTYNVMGLDLGANLSDAEVNDSPTWDFLSNGVKMRNSYASFNVSGSNYIYACFAENPFKNSLAR